MYRIIIVDDEDIVRQGIIKNMDWNNLGFTVVGEAEDGAEALDLVQSLCPDLVLADIRMPLMDGLELTKQIESIMPFVKVAFLTGHDEFEYAQQSVKLGVIDYILKPFGKHELAEMLTRIKQKLDIEANENKEKEVLKHQLMQNMPILKERFLNDLLFTDMDSSQFNEKQLFYNLNLNGANSILFAVEIADYNSLTKSLDEQERQLIRFTLLNKIKDLATMYKTMTVFEVQYDYIVILYCSDDQPDLMLKNIVFFTDELQNFSQARFQCSVSIGISNFFKNILHARISFQEALSALDYKYIWGNNAVIHFSDIQNDSFFHYSYPHEIEKQILICIKQNHKESIDGLLEGMCKSILEPTPVPWEYALIMFSQLLTSLLKLMQESGLNATEQFADQNLYLQVLNLKSIPEMHEWFTEIIIGICTSIAKTRNTINKNIVEKAVAFIADNYTCESLSFKDVASHVNLSESYLSVLFKNEAGEPFQNYLIRIRLEASKELLRTTDISINEISIRVGYSNPQYFSTAFKKNVGVTPGDYRKI